MGAIAASINASEFIKNNYRSNKLMSLFKSMLGYLSQVRNQIGLSRIRVRNLISVRKNQAQILKLSKSEKRILLKPKTLGGNVEHYYHFILDLALPLNNLINKTSPKNVFLVENNLGPFTERLLQLYPDRVEILDRGARHREICSAHLIGMNPRHVLLTKNTLEKFRKDTCHRLQIGQSIKPSKILLIERLPPEEYFLTKAKIKGGGALRRSILNHEALVSKLQTIVKYPSNFYNLRLEKLPFQEQIELFDKAAVVVAQHGAGLTNCIWVRSGGVVIEIGDNNNNHAFRKISQLRNLQYFHYRTESEHTTLDLNDFIPWLLSKSICRQYFN
jgi:hypothetical protein